MFFGHNKEHTFICVAHGFPLHCVPMFIRKVAAVLALAACVCRGVEPMDVSSQIERIREEHEVPALAVAAMDEGQLVAIGAAGLRSAKDDKPVALDDQWIVSSITKSMTASLAAMLVEDGRIRWKSTIAEVLPDLAYQVDASWREVPLELLLVHRAGAPHDPPADLWSEAQAQHGTPQEQRTAFVKGLLKNAPTHRPGTHWEYSDSGYAIAGAMIERAAGKPLEELLRTRIFEPIGLHSAGFGAPATPGQLDQPWGHTGYEPPFAPVPPGPDADYPPAIAAAATVHMSIADLARYAQWHVDGARGDGWLLSDESFEKLHTPPEGQSYAMGWTVTKRRWANGIVLMHPGQNTNSYAVVWLGPKENTCFVAACNADCQGAQDACDDAIRLLINEF